MRVDDAQGIARGRIEQVRSESEIDDGTEQRSDPDWAACGFEVVGESKSREGRATTSTLTWVREREKSRAAVWCAVCLCVCVCYCACSAAAAPPRWA